MTKEFEKIFGRGENKTSARFPPPPPMVALNTNCAAVRDLQELHTFAPLKICTQTVALKIYRISH